MILNLYWLRMYWSDRPETPAQCAGRFARTIDGLYDFDPTFGQWKTASSPGKNRVKQFCKVPADEEELAAIFLKHRRYYDVPPDKLWPEMGYSFGTSNGMADPFYSMMLVHAGANLRVLVRSNSIYLFLSKRRLKTGQPWQGSEMREIMRLLIEAWDPNEANVSRHDQSEYLTQADNGKTLLPSGGWLTYLTPEQIPRVALPPDFHVEKLANGGLIVTLCEEPLTMDNPRHVELTTLLNSVLRPIQAPP